MDTQALISMYYGTELKLCILKTRFVFMHKNENLLAEVGTFSNGGSISVFRYYRK